MDGDGKEKKSLTLFQVSKHKSDDDLVVLSLILEE